MTVGQVFPGQYEQQLAEKTASFRQLLQAESLNFPEPEVFTSPVSHFRMRAEFRVWHQGDDSYYIMFDPETRDKIRIDQFPVGNSQINQLMTRIRERFLDSDILRRKLYQVEFLTSTRGEALVTLIYHRPLDELWQKEALKLQEELNIRVIGRSRKQKMIISDNWVTEEMEVRGQTFSYRQEENTFTQPNAAVCQHMLNWACSQDHFFEGDLLELYCGNGNFTLPLSRYFPQVLATEISRSSIRNATVNQQQNDCGNITFAKASSEDFSAAWLSGDQKKLNRLHGDKSFSFGTLMVDPPRAGLDEATLNLAEQFSTIIYISCNPVTLAANLARLSDRFSIEKLAVFDQFPYTHHLECGVILRRK